MPKLPKDAGPDTLRYLKDLEEQVRLLRTGNVDLQKRRFINAHPAVSRGDFITKGEFDDTVEQVAESLNKVNRSLRRAIAGVVVSGGVGASLPPPNHPMDFGYYKVNTEIFGGDFTDEVKGYTNLVYVGPVDYGPGDPPGPPSDRIAKLTAAISKFAQNNIYMMLDTEFGQILTHGDTLSAARPYWDKVKYICMGDEPDMTAAQLDSEIQQERNRIANLGLPARPMGVTLTPATTLNSDIINAQQLDFINIEAYTPTPQNHGDSQQNLATVRQLVERMVARIPASKKLVLILQGYDRNGCFRPISPDLVDMQDASYLWVKDNTRVAAMLSFSYGREGATGDCGVEYGGAHRYPELAARHRAIWAAISGGTGGGPATACGQGRPCCGGEDNNPNCPRWCSGGDYETPVRDAQDRYGAVAPPTVIDPDNRNHVLDPPAYMAGVVATFNTDNPSLIARVDPGHDGKEIQVKRLGATDFHEQHVLWSGGGDQAFVRRFYAATCYPAEF